MRGVVDDVDRTLVDVVVGAEVAGTGSVVVVVVVAMRRVVVVARRTGSVLTGTRTAGTSSVRGGGAGRTHR